MRTLERYTHAETEPDDGERDRNVDTQVWHVDVVRPNAAWSQWGTRRRGLRAVIIGGLEEPGQEQDLRARFIKLADEWENDTLLVSSTHEIVLHPAYQSIMTLGPGGVPLILERLRNQGGQWFWALHHMTGAQPVDENAPTAEAREAWLSWGRANGRIANS
jgi:hypothetical protein